MIQSIKEKNDELEILKVELEKSTSNLEVQRKSYEQKLIELPLWL
jgi:DNA mismatch repair protein MutS2